MKNLFSFIILSYILIGLPRGTEAEKVPILIYHSIAEYEGHGTKELYVTPENFKLQMSYLKNNGYTLLSFEHWDDIAKVNKPVFITFDDGYKNNLNAFLVFQNLQSRQFMPMGTIFVISDFIGRSNRLSASDLKRMANSGLISIQSHTATHPDLTKVENLTHELRDSKIKIEEVTGKPVIAIAYPYGNTNDQVVEITKKYYEFGLTTTPGSYIPAGIKNENYILPRTYVKYSTTLKEFIEMVRVQ